MIISKTIDVTVDATVETEVSVHLSHQEIIEAYKEISDMPCIQNEEAKEALNEAAFLLRKIGKYGLAYRLDIMRFDIP